MTVVCSMASFGSSVQVRHGATCQKSMPKPIPISELISFLRKPYQSTDRPFCRKYQSAKRFSYGQHLVCRSKIDNTLAGTGTRVEWIRNCALELFDTFDSNP